MPRYIEKANATYLVSAEHSGPHSMGRDPNKGQKMGRTEAEMFLNWPKNIKSIRSECLKIWANDRYGES